MAIVSPKAQTTRTRLLGIAIEGEAQVLLLDTPGIFAPKRESALTRLPCSRRAAR